jgi:hypothetical protein
MMAQGAGFAISDFKILDFKIPRPPWGDLEN